MSEGHTSFCAAWGVAEKYSGAPVTTQTLVNLAADVVKALGHTPTPLVKCIHCGQWAAVFTACASCGAPVDPQD